MILIFLLMFSILIQKGKGSLGLGSMGGGTQMLFGGSGGQDFFQKATWTMGALFMMGSLVLAIMKTSSMSRIRYQAPRAPAAQEQPLQKQASAEDTAAAQS